MCDCNCLKTTLNIVKDFDVLQGYPDFGQIPLRRNIDVKRVLLENNSDVPVLIAIHPYQYGKTPKSQFELKPRMSKNIGVNTAGDYHQFVWLFDHDSHKVIGDPHIIHRQVNNLVINKGLNRWWIKDYRQPSYKP